MATAYDAVMSGEQQSGLSQAFGESAEQIVGRYDDWALDYVDDVRSWGYTLPEDLASALVGHAPVGRILDAGCGTGLIGHALVERGIAADRITGVDASIASLAVAAESGVYGQVARVDLTAALPFDDRTFGAIICGGVFTYLPDTAHVLREFVRVLRPGGVIIFSQRTDLWTTHETDEALAQLRAQGLVVEIGERRPYLPGLADYGQEIEVFFVSVVNAR